MSNSSESGPFACWALVGHIPRSAGGSRSVLQSAAGPPGPAAPAAPAAAPGSRSAAPAAAQPALTLVTESDRLLPPNSPVVVPAGAGLLAETAEVVPQTGSPRVFLITDAGERFEILGSDTLGALGYTGAAGHVVPDPILSLLPAGPTLSVAAAREELPWSAG